MNSRFETDPALRAEQRCLTCGTPHVRQDGPTPTSPPSWADLNDSHAYRPESWEAVAHRLAAAAAAAEAAPLDVERLARAAQTLGHGPFWEQEGPNVQGERFHTFNYDRWAIAIAREYAALRTPDTETAGEAG